MGALCVCMCTRAGRFMGSLLEVVSRWHASESVYEQVSSPREFEQIPMGVYTVIVGS